MVPAVRDVDVNVASMYWRILPIVDAAMTGQEPGDSAGCQPHSGISRLIP